MFRLNFWSFVVCSATSFQLLPIPLSLRVVVSVSVLYQVLEAKPHKAAAIRPPTTHYENCQSNTNQTGHYWRSRDELISNVLLWTPSHGQAKAGWPARTYIQQLCEDTGCSPEDLLEAMNDRERWRKRVRDICANGTTKKKKKKMRELELLNHLIMCK